MAERSDRLPVLLMAILPVLSIRVGVTFLRFQSRRKQGVRHFRHTLEAGGMPRQKAALLAQVYHDAGSLSRIIRSSFP